MLTQNTGARRRIKWMANVFAKPTVEVRKYQFQHISELEYFHTLSEGRHLQSAEENSTLLEAAD